jgi:membrane-associated phospholipid phosphatase
MKLILIQNKWFYLPYLLVLIISAVFLVHFTKADIHLFLNQHNSNFFDILFKYLTILGNGICLPVFLLIMVQKRFRDGLYLLIVFLLSGFFVQFLKLVVFRGVARPLKYFGDAVQLHLVNGVDQLCCNSFPSGHSATAFGFYLCFAIVSKNNCIKFLMLVLASLVAYSRVYLSQHFLIDIFAGSLLGVIVATTCYPWIYSLKGPWLEKNLKTITLNKFKSK